MDDLVTLAHTTIALFQQHAPWLAEKFGGAVITQSVRELWEQTKGKLGHGATAKLEAKPDDSVQWAVFQGKLIEALDEDETFRLKVQEATRSVAAHTTVQHAVGHGNQQISVSGSQDVKIDVR